MRFARENTNDRGEKLSLGSAQYIIRQFKIYIEMVWEILNEMPADKNQHFVVAPFPPPPLIGRVQDLLMTYTKVYRNFCFDVFGKTLLKNTNYDNSFEIYSKYLEKYRSKIDSKKYPVLQSKIWPKFTNQ